MYYSRKAKDIIQDTMSVSFLVLLTSNIGIFLGVYMLLLIFTYNYPQVGTIVIGFYSCCIILLSGHTRFILPHKKNNEGFITTLFEQIMTISMVIGIVYLLISFNSQFNPSNPLVQVAVNITVIAGAFPHYYRFRKNASEYFARIIGSFLSGTVYSSKKEVSPLELELLYLIFEPDLVDRLFSKYETKDEVVLFMKDPPEGYFKQTKQYKLVTVDVGDFVRDTIDGHVCKDYSKCISCEKVKTNKFLLKSIGVYHSDSEPDWHTMKSNNSQLCTYCQEQIHTVLDENGYLDSTTLLSVTV